MKPGEGAFDDPAVAAEPGAVLSLSASDHRLDAALPDEPTVLVVVVAAVGDQHPWSASWPADAAAHWRHPVEQLDQLRDVVAVAAGEPPGERNAAAVYEQVVLAACPAAIDRTGTRFGPVPPAPSRAAHPPTAPRSASSPQTLRAPFRRPAGQQVRPS